MGNGLIVLHSIVELLDMKLVWLVDDSLLFKYDNNAMCSLCLLYESDFLTFDYI